MSEKISPAEYVARMATAVRRLTEEQGSFAVVELGWPNLIAMVGCLQLALRHPTNRGEPARMAREIIQKVYDSFPPGHRDIVTLLKLGDVPANDC